jgi:hypothetical protein
MGRIGLTIISPLGVEACMGEQAAVRWLSLTTDTPEAPVATVARRARR